MPLLKPVEQSAYFPATAKQLYNLYLNDKTHAAFTGAPAKITPKPGGKFSACDNQLTGTILTLIPNHLIVQRWRSTHWKKSDPDSILTLTFHLERRGCRIHLVHLNVPAHDHQGVTKGWPHYYWNPLRDYLKRTTRKSRRSNR